MRKRYNELAAGGCGGVYQDTVLGRKLLASENILSRLSDEQRPGVGCEFVSKLRESGCRESGADLGDNLPAAFWSFNPNWGRSFAPRIQYNTKEDRSPQSVTMSRVHEGDHAMAYANAAIIHTSPFNTNASYCVMCPETFLTLVDLTERNAYVKQAWLASLAVKQDPDFYSQTEDDPITAREFELMRERNGGDLDATLLTATQGALSKWKKDCGSYANHYHAGALEAYEARLKYLHEKGIQPFFVKMDMTDLADVGNTYGPNIFAGREEFLRCPKLSDKNAAHLQRLNTAYGLDQRPPMTFTNLLAMRGDSRQNFLHMSKNWAKRVKTPEFIQSLAA